MNSYLKFLRSANKSRFGISTFLNPSSGISNVERVAQIKAQAKGKGTAGFWEAIARSADPEKIMENVSSEDILNATSEERSRFEKIAKMAAKKSALKSMSEKDRAKFLSKSEQEQFDILEKSLQKNEVNPFLLIGLGTITGGIFYQFVLSKMLAIRSGSVNEDEPIDFVSRRAEMIKKGLIPVSQNSEGQSEIIDFTAQLNKRNPLKLDELKTLKKNQMLNELRSAHLGNRKIQFSPAPDDSFLVSDLYLLIESDRRATRALTRTAGRTFTNLILAFPQWSTN